MSVALCKTLSQTLSDDELAMGWRILYEEHQRRADRIASKNKVVLKSGDRVQWLSQKEIQTGTVDRVKRKKAFVFRDLNGKPSKGERWDIPLGMLTKIS